jgi:hypothetical protein
MLAGYLIAQLVLELGLYAFGARLAAAQGVPLACCLLLALATAIVVRVLLVATSFAIAQRFHAPRPRLTLPQAVRLFLGELFAFTLLFTLLQPLARWFARQPAPRWLWRPRRWC